MNILFDLDGTILDASDRLYQLFQKLVPQSELSKEEYWNYKRNKINHRMIINNLFLEINYEQFYRQWMEKIETKEYLKLDTVYPGTLDVLQRLYLCHDLILFSARQSKERLLWELGVLGMHRYFSRILVTEGEKSKNDLLREAISSHIISKNTNDLYISDMGSDILVGKLNGYRTVGITHGFMNREKLKEYGPDYLIDELEEVCSIICM